MIIVTGAAGFIGSQLVRKLNEENFNAIIAVDKFDNPIKNQHLEGCRLFSKVDRDEFHNWIKENHREVEFIFHIGARTDTAEFDRDLLFSLNTEYSQKIWSYCVDYQIPLVYASSAATYGAGEQGYADDDKLIPNLKPLNPYGESKNTFDLWVLNQKSTPFFWAGLKFFNVYGANEDHKGRMASVIWHAYHQIRETGGMKLFRSHRPDYNDGEQRRDFIYVRDVVNVCYFLMRQRKYSGIFNLGTGNARTFLELTKAVFKSMNKPENISFIDTPLDIRDKYQYFTEAKMDKLRNIGYDQEFTDLEQGVKEYVTEYLLKKYPV
jgi:ADP-L-glycero-D-manno-heptose 6-epimerase